MRTAYLRFCLYFGLRPVPAEHSTILRYTAFLAHSLNPSSIPGYLNVVRLMHLEVGADNPLDNWSLSMLKRGITRLKGQPPKQKLPISPVILKQIYDKLDMAEPFNAAFWCTCLVGFYTFCRKSTLLPESLTKHKPEKDLCINDVSYPNQDHAILTVRHTKTIQFGQRILSIPLQRIPGSPLCPVSALEHLAKFQENFPGDSHLFSFTDGGRYNTLCYLYIFRESSEGGAVRLWS